MMTSFMISSGSIEVARGNLPEEHLFNLEEAKLSSVLGMPASSLAPEQLSRGSDLSRGIIRNSKLLTPTGISCVASSLAPQQLSRGSDLSQGIIRSSKLLTPTGISVAWMAPRAGACGAADEQGRARAPRARVTAQLLHISKRCSSGMSPRTTSNGPDDVINDVIN